MVTYLSGSNRRGWRWCEKVVCLLYPSLSWGCVIRHVLYALMFLILVQDCEASPHCRRLQLKDMLVSEMQRLTKYPLLLDNIIKHTEGEESRDTEHMNPQQMKRFLRMMSLFIFSWFARPPLTPACPGLLSGDITGCQRGRKGNRTPAKSQPVPAPAGSCPSV